MAVHERVALSLLDYHDLRTRTMQATIDELVAENERLTEHIERLALDLAMKESDFKGVIK